MKTKTMTRPQLLSLISSLQFKLEIALDENQTMKERHAETVETIRARIDERRLSREDRTFLKELGLPVDFDRRN